MVAAKGGSPDPSQNAALRLAVDKAKAQNMPKDNIQKAIEKATGGADGANFESVRYEGYGPNGVAFMVDCLTDNRNRTASMVRSSFTKAGGNLGTDNSFTSVRDALEAAGVKEFLECELTYVPNMEVSLEGEAAEKVMNLVETLEDIDDVQDVYYNLKED